MRFSARVFAFRRIAVCILAVTGVVQSEPPKAVSAIPNVAEIICAPTDLAALRKRVGRRVVIEGEIVAMGQSRSGSTSYLNFTKNYHDSVSLVFLGGSGAKGIPKDQLAAFIGRKIHVGGLIEDRSGALQMRVFELEQIKVLP